MEESTSSEDESDVERRKFLSAIGVGVGATGLGGIGAFSGLSQADREIEIVDTQPLTQGEAERELDLALRHGSVHDLTTYLTNGSLEPLYENVWGDRLLTTDEEFNQRNPAALCLPYVSRDEAELGFYWTVTYDADGGRAATSGFGATIEHADGRYFRNFYAYQDRIPRVIDSELIEFDPIEICINCMRIPVEIICIPEQLPPIEDGCLGTCQFDPCGSACGSLMSYYTGEVCTARWEYVCHRSFNC